MALWHQQAAVGCSRCDAPLRLEPLAVGPAEAAVSKQHWTLSGSLHSPLRLEPLAVGPAEAAVSKQHWTLSGSLHSPLEPLAVGPAEAAVSNQHWTLSGSLHSLQLKLQCGAPRLGCLALDVAPSLRVLAHVAEGLVLHS